MNLSEKIANYLIEVKGIEDKDQQEILTYGAEVFINTVIGTAITLGLGYFLGLLKPLLAMLLVSVMIRKTAGGAHSNSPVNCLLITVAAYNFMALLAVQTLVYIKEYLLFINILTFLICFTITIIKAPVESPNKPLNSKQKKQLKIISIFSLLILLVIEVITYINSYLLINYAINIILIWQCLMLTSFGIRIISFMDKVFIFSKGGDKHEKN